MRKLRLFEGVKTLEVVSEDYTNKRCERGLTAARRRSQLVFTELVDIDRRFYLFKHPDHHVERGSSTGKSA